MNKLFRFITDRPLWVNILAALAIVALLALLFFSSLSWLTKHNKYIKVPTVVGKSVNDATQVLEAAGFDVEVQDSVYLDGTPPLAVIKQTPEPEAVVKTNRTIYLTINRAVPPLVEMPDLRGYSFTSAELLLKSLNLKLGDTTYRPDIARNAVLQQLFNGREIRPGTRINMGSVISLVLGDGIGNAQLEVPDIVGMTFAQAQGYLQSMNLSVGAVVADPDVQDQQNAYVYKQSPTPYAELVPGQRSRNRIKPGQVIDVYLSVTPPVKQEEPPATPDTTRQQ